MVFGCCGNKSSYDTTKDTKSNADLTSGQHPVFLQQSSVVEFKPSPVSQDWSPQPIAEGGNSSKEISIKQFSEASPTINTQITEDPK